MKEYEKQERERGEKGREREKGRGTEKKENSKNLMTDSN